ncbi:MAG: hypothetical protein NZ937_09915, partial [Armatimonadetes bacterium]|nr:hypothetical protein [Armatimonadota bacterium]
RPEQIALAIEQLLTDKSLRKQIQLRLTKVYEKLGEPKAGLRIANFLAQWLGADEKRLRC